MGYHSHSWLTAEEMLAWADAAPNVVQTGVLDRAAYAAWDGKSRPTEYSGDVWGRSTLIINDNKLEREAHPHWTHIRVDWDSSMAEELAYFFNEVRRLKAEHGEVRFVFGFDS